MELHGLTIQQASALLWKRQVSSVDLTHALLGRIQAVEEQVRAFVTVTAELALSQAGQADALLAQGKGGPLTGVPMALKDLICTRGVRTTCSSRMLESFLPPYDAMVTERLREAGAVMLGKTNMDEFAMGSSTENSAFFPTHNPWDLERVPGGSSGGSAAAVSADEVFFTLGSDTGGSIRQPASLCGVVGLKPTYGLVSRYGLVAFASSLDQIGPMTKSVADCALVLNAITGHDERDSTSAAVPAVDYAGCLSGDIKGVRVAVPREYFATGLDPGTERAVRAAIAQLEVLGAEVEEVSLPHTEYGLASYYIIAPAEASANLARYDGVKYGFSSPEYDELWAAYMHTRGVGFGPEVKLRIMLGAYALSSGYYDAYYLKAQKVRTLIKRDFDEVFQRFDVVVAPTSPTPAFRLGERMADPMAMKLADVCTIPVNMAGLPGISIPCGFSDGLPVGLQVISKAFGEESLLRVAHAYEQSTDWHTRKPPLN